MRLLITGAGGFAGSHLAELCAARGDEVWGTIWPVRAQAEMTPRYGERELIPLNIADAAGVAEAVRRARPEGIIHLAGMAFVPQATADPRGAYEANFLGTANLLAAVKQCAPGARVVVADVGVAEDLKPHPNLIIKKIKRGTQNMAKGPAMTRADLFPFRARMAKAGWKR